MKNAVRLVLRYIVLLLAVQISASFAMAQTCEWADVLVLDAPANNATGQDVAGTLQWHLESTGSATGTSPTRYAVYLSTTSPCGGSEPAFVTDIIASRAIAADYSNLLPSTTYYWRVEGFRDDTGSCRLVSSSCGAFTTGCTASGPGLISPENGASDTHLKTVVAWDAVPGAIGYRVTVDGATVAEVGATTFEHTFVPTPGTHSWSVSALFTNCTPAVSETRTFSVSCPTGTPSLVEPFNGATLSSPKQILLQWAPVDSDLPTIVHVQRVGGTETTVTVPEVSSSATLDVAGPGEYEWWVESPSSGCATLTSARSRFTVADFCPSQPPALVAPADAASFTGTTLFQWNGSPAVPSSAGFQRYDVYLSVDGGASFAPVYSGTDLRFEQRLAPGNYQWYVEQVFASCATLQSARRSFKVDAVTCPTAAPTLLTPAPGGSSVSSPVRFTWSAVDGATSYDVFVPAISADPIGTVTGSELTAVVPVGTHDWYVRANLEGCAALTSAAAPFTVGSTQCPTTKPAVVAPTNIVRDSLDDGGTLTWSKVDLATSYTVTASGPNGTTSYTTTDNSYPITGTEQAQILTFRVAANFSGCASVESDTVTVSLSAVPQCPSPVVTRIGPSDATTSLTQKVHFQWAPVPEATAYELYAGPVTTRNSEELPLVARTTATEFTAASLPSGQIEWYVLPVFSNGCPASEGSDRGFFQIPAQIQCPDLEAAVAKNPFNGDMNVGAPVTFTWEAGAGGVEEFSVWVKPAGGTYAPLRNSDGSTRFPLSTLSVTQQLDQGSYTWKVVSHSGLCREVSSGENVFTVAACTVDGKSVNPPVATAPAAGSEVVSPVRFEWSSVPTAIKYELFISSDGSSFNSAGAVTDAALLDAPRAIASLPTGDYQWYVKATLPTCLNGVSSARNNVRVIPAPPCTDGITAPKLGAPTTVTSNAPYAVNWTAVPNAETYEVQESTSPTFEGATTITTASLKYEFSHGVAAVTTYYYRVRAKSAKCAAESEWSVVQVDVDAQSNEVQVGSTATLLKTVFVPGQPGITQRFRASTDREGFSVTPAEGLLPPEGVTLTLLVEPEFLDVGSNDASILLEFISSAKLASNSSTVTAIPVTINVVAPVSNQGKSSMQGSSKMIPAVAAAAGANGSEFRSDVRIANLSSQPQVFTMFFTPSGVDSRQFSQAASLPVEAGQSVALNDVLSTWFGRGRSGENITGSIEIRPQSEQTNSGQKTSSFQVASRTYNKTAEGTYGQFIPGVSLSQFVRKQRQDRADATLSIQQVEQSANYRTNVGLLEGAGEPATVRISAYDNAGTLTRSVEVNLRPGEHQQLNQLIATHNLGITRGRLEIDVISDTGRVTAYASVVDNRTNDPMLVSPVRLGHVADQALVIPGIADLNTGVASWRSDVRIFNAGTAPVTATLTFYPMNLAGAPTSKSVTFAAGETKEFDDILRSTFNLSNVGGALHITALEESKLVATARTYNLTGNGTYGQFIPAVGVRDAVGFEEGSLQVLQVEESARYRTNLGVAEVTGKPVVMELTAVLPGSDQPVRMRLPMRPYEFVQFTRVLAYMGVGEATNARIAVAVVEGEGQIIAYGSVIDNQTQDPTYVPAQQ